MSRGFSPVRGVHSIQFQGSRVQTPRKHSYGCTGSLITGLLPCKRFWTHDRTPGGKPPTQRQGQPAMHCQRGPAGQPVETERAGWVRTVGRG